MQQKYLITIRRDTDLDEFLSRAKAIGCETTADSQPIPMSGGDSVIAVEGPTESLESLAEIPGVRKVSRSSELHLH